MLCLGVMLRVKPNYTTMTHCLDAEPDHILICLKKSKFICFLSMIPATSIVGKNILLRL